MSEYLFDFIIPICNSGGDDFEARVKNIQLQIDSYPENVHIILIEQVVNVSAESFKSHLRFRHKSNVTYDITIYRTFNKSWLYNIGTRMALTDKFIFGEADCTPTNTPGYFDRLYSYIKLTDIPWMFCWNEINYYDEDKTTVVRNDHPRKGYAEGGLVYFEKSYLTSIGGANEFLQELGGIDNELIRRAEQNGYYHMFPESITHHYHPISKYKKNDWEMARYRDNNRRIYYYTDKNPQVTISILLSLSNDLGRKDSIDNKGPILTNCSWDMFI